jgi:acetyl-CoA carboxylase biotin carboxyl carrier protein
MSTPTVREEDEMELSPDDIRRVLEALDKSEWDEAVITVGDVRIAVARNGASLPTGQEAIPAAPAPAAESASAPAPAPVTAPVASSAAAGGPTLLVTAPSVGVFWRSPEPAARPFVEVGQHVNVGDTMGIVEVMKLMSHVDAPAAGTVIEIHVDNAGSVEHGAPLFTLALEES